MCQLVRVREESESFINENKKKKNRLWSLNMYKFEGGIVLS